MCSWSDEKRVAVAPMSQSSFVECARRKEGSSGRRGFSPPLPSLSEAQVIRELGSMLSAGALRGLGLESREAPQQQQTPEESSNPFTSLIPWLTSMSANGNQLEKPESKPTKYLVAKGLHKFLTMLVEKVWNLEYVGMEEFLPAPRALLTSDQSNPSHSLRIAWLVR